MVLGVGHGRLDTRHRKCTGRNPGSTLTRSISQFVVHCSSPNNVGRSSRFLNQVLGLPLRISYPA